MSALATVTSGLYTLLEAAGLSATVYRHVPQNPSFPYVTVKSGTENRLDTFGRGGKTLLLQVHVFTSSDEYAGAGLAQTVVAEIAGATNYAALTLTGYDLIFCRPEDAFDVGSEVIDGIEYQHYVQTVRVEVMPA